MVNDVLAASLPAKVKSILQAADDHGWELNGKGASFCIRLDHPTDEFAVPVYITWQLGRTPKGSLSWRFMSAGTATLQPMSLDDVLNYLKDPTILYPTVLYSEGESE